MIDINASIRINTNTNVHVCLDVTHNHYWIRFENYDICRTVYGTFVLETHQSLGFVRVFRIELSKYYDMRDYAYEDKILSQLYHGVFKPSEYDVELVHRITEKHPSELSKVNINYPWYLPNLLTK